MDNIGGIISASYALVKNVKSCAVIDSGIKISLNDLKPWIELPTTPGKTDITVTPGTDDLFTVAGTIYCARFNLSKYNEFISLQFQKILLKYTTANGDVLVAGDKETPLTVKPENVNPSQANGYSGTKLTISGIMKHPELIVIE